MPCSKLSIVFGLCLFFPAFLGAADLGSFSQPAPPKANLKDLTSQETSSSSKPVLLEGQVEKICEKKGCWMILKDGEQSVRVTFKGYSFFVNKQVEGQRVLLEGVLKRQKRSVGDQKHFLEDAGASKAEQEAVKEAKVVWEFEASGVRILAKI